MAEVRNQQSGSRGRGTGADRQAFAELFLAGTQVWKLSDDFPVGNPELAMASTTDILPTDPLARAATIATVTMLSAAADDERCRDCKRKKNERVFTTDDWKADPNDELDDDDGCEPSIFPTLWPRASSWKRGEKILIVNVYPLDGRVDPGIPQGSQSQGRFGDFNPIIAELICEDQARMATVSGVVVLLVQFFTKSLNPHSWACR
ncbi:hypothetical protein [Neorhodopirellula pilleata]|uniref:Uncharacterized protein n=1 Tax=Neorhodopirellula pilleata TaxID=2714738 RepID=A0A5C6AD99_9BACT|nr:hypothetical protein [Neorhodopirellula pilleata]TWT97410.1 hypothetical protein Pla100_25620 [Neorhodopirellula pilleata]